MDKIILTQSHGQKQIHVDTRIRDFNIHSTVYFIHTDFNTVLLKSRKIGSFTNVNL